MKKVFEKILAVLPLDFFVTYFLGELLAVAEEKILESDNTLDDRLLPLLRMFRLALTGQTPEEVANNLDELANERSDLVPVAMAYRAAISQA